MELDELHVRRSARRRGRPWRCRRRSRCRGWSCRGTPCRRRRWRAAWRARQRCAPTPRVEVEHVGAPAGRRSARRDRASASVSRSTARWRSRTRMLGSRAHRGDERAHDLAAGGVRGVQDAAVAVPALAAEVVLGVLAAVAAARSGCRARSARGCAPVPRARRARRGRGGRARRRRRACPRRAPRTSPRGSTPRRCRPARSSVALSGRRSLVSTRTVPWRAACRAKVRPARPLPMTRKVARPCATCCRLICIAAAAQPRQAQRQKKRLTVRGQCSYPAPRMGWKAALFGAGVVWSCSRWRGGRQPRSTCTATPRRACTSATPRSNPGVPALGCRAPTRLPCQLGRTARARTAARRKAFDPIIRDAAQPLPGRSRAGQGGDPRRVRLRALRALAEGGAGPDAAHAGDGAPAQRVARLRAASRTSRAACSHLRLLLDQYNGNVRLALAAYNAGEGAVERHGGDPAVPGDDRVPGAGPALPRAVPARAREPPRGRVRGARRLDERQATAAPKLRTLSQPAEPHHRLPHPPHSRSSSSCCSDPGPTASVLAAFTFFLACWSDFLDGYLARRHGISTTLGKLLDPLADKLIVMAALVMLAAMPREPRVPAWMVVLIVGRELAVTGLRAVAVGEGIVLGRRGAGQVQDDLPDVRPARPAAALPLPRRRFLHRRNVLPLDLAGAQPVVGRRLPRAGHPPCDSSVPALPARSRSDAESSSDRKCSARCSNLVTWRYRSRPPKQKPCIFERGLQGTVLAHSRCMTERQRAGDGGRRALEKRGFTLIELLVVVAISGSWRRSRCRR